MAGMNPYAPSALSDTNRSDPASDAAVTTGRRLQTLLIGAAGLSALLAVLDTYYLRSFAVGAVPTFDMVYGGTALATVLLTLVIAVLFCQWMNRCNRQLRSQGAMLSYGPNAWGWFFCPILNLFKPYAAVKELYTGARGHFAVPGVFPLWWGVWIADNILGNIEMRLSLREEFIQSSGLAVLSLTTSVLGIATALLCWQVVRDTTNAIEASSSAVPLAA